MPPASSAAKPPPRRWCIRNYVSVLSLLVLVLVAAIPSVADWTKTWEFDSERTDRAQHRSSRTCRPDVDHLADDGIVIDRNSTTSLHYGDLPGYTGWPRPSWTSSSWYQVLPSQQQPQQQPQQPQQPWDRTAARVGQPWSLDVICRVPACHEVNAVFDCRAYGPSVLAGVVQRHPPTPPQQRGAAAHNRTFYRVEFIFHRPGQYVVEIVLAFSNVLALRRLPHRKGEPYYEGYLLPDMPKTIVVLPTETTSFNSTNNKETQQRECTTVDLTETSTTSALSRGGTWVIQERVRSHVLAQLPPGSNTHSQDLKPDYLQGGLGSLGIRMSFERPGCHLPSMVELAQRLKTFHKQIYVIFIGDSNMNAQIKVFRRAVGDSVKFSYFTVHGSLPLRLRAVQQSLMRLRQVHQQRAGGDLKKKPAWFLLFNSGLHDVHELCCTASRARPLITNASLDEFSCQEQYVTSLQQLVSTLLVEHKDDFALRVWQTTTAGWPRWGNFGFTWDLRLQQHYPRHPSVCEALNQLAWPILQQQYNKGSSSDGNQHHSTTASGGMTSSTGGTTLIHVMDAYWMTLARPDHRETDENSTAAFKLVHLGFEIYDVLIRQWMKLILDVVEAQ